MKIQSRPKSLQPLRSRRGGAAIEHLMLVAAIAAVAVPVVMKFAGQRTNQTLKENRSRMVGFLAQNRKTKVPNHWFASERTPTPNPKGGPDPGFPSGPGGGPSPSPTPNPNPTPSPSPGIDPQDPFVRNDPGPTPPDPAPGSPGPRSSPEPHGTLDATPRMAELEGNPWAPNPDPASPNGTDTKSPQRADTDGAAVQGKSEADTDSVSGPAARMANRSDKTARQQDLRRRLLGSGQHVDDSNGIGSGSWDWWLLLRLLLVILIILILLWFLVAEMRRRG